MVLVAFAPWMLLVIITIIRLDPRLRAANDDLRYSLSNFADRLNVVVSALFVLAGLWLLVRTALRATRLIGQQRSSQQAWELFVLTGTRAPDYVRRVWLETVRSQWYSALILTAIRALALTGLIALGETLWRYPFAPQLDQSELLIVIVIVIAFTLLPFLYAAAVGTLAGITARRRAKAWRAIVLFLVLGILGALAHFLVLLGVDRIYLTSPTRAAVGSCFLDLPCSLVEPIYYLSITLFDGGVASPAIYAGYMMGGKSIHILVTLVVYTVILLGFIQTLLAISARIARRHGLVA